MSSIGNVAQHWLQNIVTDATVAPTAGTPNKIAPGVASSA